MDITNTWRLYAECISSGAITEPTGGSWISAICIYEGSTEPLNASWLQRHCDNLGIAGPLHGSWLIALADHYGETEPINGTWAYAILVGCGAIPPPTDLIWDLTITEWQDETTDWATATAPAAPVFPDVTFTDIALPTLVGTADPNVSIYMTIDTYDYQTTSDGLGDWSITLTDALPQALSPGNDYTANTYAWDPTTGLTSSTTITTVTMITTVTAVNARFDLLQLWGNGWLSSGMQVQQETSPGVWTPIEYEGNPSTFQFPDFTGTEKFYKTEGTGAYNWSSGIYTMRRIPYDPGAVPNPTDPVPRYVMLDGGFNYRIVADTYGGVPSYGQFNRYTVYNDDSGDVILPLYVGTELNFSQGYVQQTFSL